MVQNESSVRATIADDDDSLRDRIGWRRLNAIVPVLVGMSQIVVAMAMNPAERSTLFLVIVAGGFLLIGLGFSEFQNKSWFKRRRTKANG